MTREATNTFVARRTSASLRGQIYATHLLLRGVSWPIFVGFDHQASGLSYTRNNVCF